MRRGRGSFVVAKWRKKKKKKKDKKIRRDENLARGGYEEEEEKKERGLFIKELPRLGSAGGIFFEGGMDLLIKSCHS